MRLSSLILFTSITLSLGAFAENAIPVGGAPSEAGENLGAEGSIGLTQENLEFILESSDVKGKFEACKTEAGADTLTEAVSTCLWVKDPNKPNLALTDDEQKAVVKQIDNLGGQTGANADSSLGKFESLDNGFLKQVNKEPSFKRLQEHMTKKLQETIYGDQKEKGLIVADHTTFHKLYKSQLTKNVIQAMSSYCLDAKPGDYLIDDQKLETQRKANITLLSSSNVTNVFIDPNDTSLGKEDQLDSEAAFNGCIRALPKVCYTTGVTYLDHSNETDPRKKAIYEYSKKRACNVVTYIKQLKQNIIAVNDIETKLDALKKDSPAGFGAGAVTNLKKTYIADDNESLTVMSSKEFVEESGFKDAVDSEVAAFEKCYKDADENDGNPGDVVDPEACKKYLSDEKEKNTKLIAEADLRSRALEKKMDDTFADDKDKGVRTYLKDQAFSEKEIEALIAKKSIDQLAIDIKNRYRAERESYIKNLAEKIQEKTKKEDSISATGNIDRLDDIRKELTTKTTRYTELVHFTNVVSGYLKVTGGASESGRNTTSLAIELGNSSYDPTGGSSSAGRTTASSGADAHTEAVKAAAGVIGVKPVIEENKDSSISAKSINDILTYE